jgi:pimeloyl-ACP methyl ester carboxylesterase
MATDLHVQTAGEGPTVLFLHGLDSDSAVWSPVIELLADHTCITVDLPGHGQSPVSDDPTRYEREAILADLDDVIGKLVGPVVLVGFGIPMPGRVGTSASERTLRTTRSPRLPPPSPSTSTAW